MLLLLDSLREIIWDFFTDCIAYYYVCTYHSTYSADDMGLGKTLSLISLVVQKRDEGIKEWMAKPPGKEGKTYKRVL